MNEQELKQHLNALNEFPMPDKQTLLANVKKAAAPATVRAAAAYPRRVRIRALLAACLTIALLMAALSVYVIAAEHIEYREALSFFEQHELSVDGLSRRDIRLVFRDIQSGSFDYERTAETIERAVGGYEIVTDTPTPAVLQALWTQKLAEDEQRESSMREGFTVNGTVTPTGISYVFKNQVRHTHTLEETYVVLECYRDGTLAWTKSYPGISATDIDHHDSYIAMTCRALLPNDKGSIEQQPALFFLDANGNELWHTALSTDAAAIFCDADGITLLSSDTSMLEIARYDLEGKCAHHAQKKFSTMGLEIVRELIDDDGKDAISIIHSNYSLENALRLSSSYILHLQEWYTKEELLIRIDENAELLGMYRFHTEGETYRFTDIAACGDTLYLSGYVIPETDIAEYDELNTLKEQLLDDQRIDDAALTAAVRDYYTAVLLRCDAQTGETNAFYSVSGAWGDSFSLDADGNLVWSVSEIATATHAISAWPGYEPNAVHIKGVGPIWEHTVSPEGILLDSRMTDDVAAFVR